MSKEKQGNTAKRTSSDQGEQATEAVIYVGPTLPKIASYAVFKDGVPKHVEKVMERIPEMRSLFLPVSEFAQRRGELNEVGSPLYVAYQTVAAQKGSV